MARERRGSIRKRNGRFYARVTFLAPNGKRKEIEKRATSRKHAKELIKQTLKQLETEGENVFIEGSMSLEKYLDVWFDGIKRRLSVWSITGYGNIIKWYIKPALGKRKLNTIRLADVLMFYNELAKTLSPKSIRNCHVVLSSALKQAVRLEIISQNPSQLAELPRMIRNEMKALSPEESRKFLVAAKEDRFHSLFMLAIITGMRPQEYLGLQWKDIDFDRKTINIQRALCWNRGGKGWYIKEPKTPKSRRSIPISASLLSELKDHKRMQSELRLKAGAKWNNLDLMFTTRTGGPLSTVYIGSKHFKVLLKKAGLDESVRLYDLRHTMATMLLLEGINPKIVSERLGHSSIVMTLDTYSHVLPTMQEEASERIEKVLFNT